MSRWTSDEDKFVLNTRNLTTQEVARQLGRTTSAVTHRRAMLGRRVGMTFAAGPKGPHIIGRRRLLAKTCGTCGLLLAADRFGLCQGTWRSRCVHCRAATQAPQPSRGPSSEQARANTQRLQAMSLPNASRHRQPYTDSDHEVLADPDLTCLEKALRTKRTYMAAISQCSKFGYHSRVGKGDPIKGQWVIDNPNAPTQSVA